MSAPRKRRPLRIAHLYPTLMNLYGDRGNIITLLHRARLRGLAGEVTPIHPGDQLPLQRFHIVFFGGGQDTEQTLIYEDCLVLKGEALRREIADGIACLAVCGGYQLLGNWYEVHGGRRITGIGALDLETLAGEERLIGNVLAETGLTGRRHELAGFENHGGRTWLGPGLSPLARVIVGSGNNGSDGGEGVHYRNTIGTYLHGPVLARNPLLADYLIEKGYARLEGDCPPAPPCSPIEQAAFEEARALTLDEHGRRREKFRRV
jgi:hypothetical protein